MAEMQGERKTCGIVMPISPIDGCSSEHWSEVRDILDSAVSATENPSFVSQLVSDADDIGVIQKRIIQNLYSAEVVLCDVSGKNPNVMFELGMRLAFDKPTVIVKDDKTDYSFDTSVIEHLTYPRDLRFSAIVQFKTKLSQKISATYEKSRSDPDHSTFLKSFGTFHVATLSETQASAETIVLEGLAEVRRELARLRKDFGNSRLPRLGRVRSGLEPGEPGLYRALMSQLIDNWITEKSCSPKDLLDDKQFYEYVAGEIDAPRRFSSYGDFRNALRSELEMKSILS